MEFIHFGKSSRKLLGAYSPPVTTSANDAAVLLCYPFGQEYMRAHMAFRQLASLLSRQGLPTMRFDYYGTGDSYGDSSEISLSIWQENTQLAVEELKGITGCSKIYLIGLRLGALVAANVSIVRRDIRRLVLWDPIVQGEYWLNELRGRQGELSPNEDWRIHGYPMPLAFREELTNADLSKLSFSEKTKIMQIVSHENSQFELLKLAQADCVEYKLIPSPGDWNYVDEVGGILLPHKIVRSIVSWIAE